MQNHSMPGALIAGLLFGTGLLLSGMTDPANVLAFLDIAGDWNPALALVMGSAVLTAAPAYAWVRRHGRTWCGPHSGLDNRRPVDAPLVAGSLLFGAGWGLSGICPGPGLMVAAGGEMFGLVFVAAMVLGMVLARFLPGGRAQPDGD